MNIPERVSKYKTKHKEGFIQSEIDDLLKEFPAIDMVKFQNALTGITCMIIDDETIIYHHDIEKALICGIEKRNLHFYERD
jgi:hypothetical protein